MATTAEALAIAAQYQEAGNRAAAEQICKEILADEPEHADALHLLGLLECRAGQFMRAAAHLEASIRSCPDDARFHNSLGIVRHRQGRHAEAITAYRRALQLSPNLAQVHNNLGNALKAEGQVDEAIACYENALRWQPDFAEPHNNLGNLLKQAGRFAEAETSYRSAVRLRPDLPQPHFNLGLVLARQDRLAEALSSYGAALRLWPDYAETHIALGDALTRMGRLVEAETSYRRALRLRPQLPLIHNNLGVVLGVQARLAESLVTYSPEGRPGGDDADAQAGAAWEAERKRDEALASHEEAIRLQPDYADALNNLACAYLNQGRLDEALTCYQKAVAARPQDPAIHSGFLFALHYHAGYDPDACFAEHLRWAAKFAPGWHGLRCSEGRAAEPRPSEYLRPCHPNERDPGRRLRIGYVSADFRSHVVGRYSEAVIAAHDRGQVEVYCYANVPQADAVTDRVKAAADHWRSLVGKSDDDAARLILHDQIDLLIDLAGHTAGNRLGIFARKPAPVQVTHFGYAASTGLAAMDYRLTDAVCDPPGQTEQWHTEKLVRLPGAWWSYVPWGSPEVTPVPAQRAGAVTFGCACTLGKVTEEMIGLWGQILNALPEARMLVVTGAGRAGNDRVRTAFARQGVAPERVTLVPRQGVDAYLRLFQGVDIGLDVYPFTGCNTTADALWMGVPVVSRYGATAATRQGLSILNQVGLAELAADTAARYVKAAIHLAGDLPRLTKLRAQLRDRVQRTLGDVERFTRDLEAAYRDMWQTYCRHMAQELVAECPE